MTNPTNPEPEMTLEQLEAVLEPVIEVDDDPRVSLRHPKQILREADAANFLECFAEADQRLDKTKPRRAPKTLSELIDVWRENARTHAASIQKGEYAYSYFDEQTRRILRQHDKEPESRLFGHGEEVFNAYRAELSKCVGNTREILSPLSKFDDPV